jgi:hypothetical protein
MDLQPVFFGRFRQLLAEDRPNKIHIELKPLTVDTASGDIIRKLGL